MTWTITQTIPTFAVPVLEVGIAFYERMGFAVDWRWPEEKPTHSGLVRGDAALMLAECDPAVKGDVYYIVDDVEACHAAVMEGKAWEMAEEAGALAVDADGAPARALEPPASPAPTGYGLRDFTVIDPWGHCLTFGQPLSEDECP